MRETDRDKAEGVVSVCVPSNKGYRHLIIGCLVLLTMVVLVKLGVCFYNECSLTYPLYAVLEPRVSLFLLLPCALFLIWVLVMEALGDSLILPASFVFSTLFNLSVAMAREGVIGVFRPFTRTDLEYIGDVSRVESVGTFLRDYTDLMPTLSGHGRTHPPGPILLLWVLRKLLGEGPLIASVCVIVLGSLSVLFVYYLARRIYNQQTARHSILLFTLVPSYVLFTATSMDAVFATLCGVSVWLFYRALTGESLTDSLLCAIVVTLALHFSFVYLTLLPFFAIVGMYSLCQSPDRKRILRNLGLMFFACLCLNALIRLATGFNIVTAFFVAKTINYSAHPLVSARHYAYIFVGNPLAFLIYLGVPTIVLFVKEISVLFRSFPRVSSQGSYVFSFLTTLFLTNSAGLFTVLEVERIWLFFVPFVAIPAGRALFQWTKQSDSQLPVRIVLTLLFVQLIAFQLLLYTYW